MVTAVGKKIKKEGVDEVEHQRTMTEYYLMQRKGESETIILMEEGEEQRSGKDQDNNKPPERSEVEEVERDLEPRAAFVRLPSQLSTLRDHVIPKPPYDYHGQYCPALLPIQLQGDTEE